ITHFLGFPEECGVDPDSLISAQENVVTQPGDIWLLGSHRVMCGDAANSDDVAQLMDGQKAHLIFIDPPYNLNYQGGVKNRRKKNQRRTIYNDDLPPDVYFSMLQAALSHAATYSEPEASLYLCHSDHQVPVLRTVLAAADFDVRAVLVWAKQHF